MVLGLLGWADDEPGRAQYRSVSVRDGREGADSSGVVGGRYALEDDGETPDLQESIFTFPGFLMTFSMREANGFRESQGTTILGTKGSLLLNGNRVVTEMKADPVNMIPRFQGHPVGGPVYTNTKPEP